MKTRIPLDGGAPKMVYSFNKPKSALPRGREMFMELKALLQAFAVCKLNDMANVNLNTEFCYFARTDEELSLVCEEGCIPPNTAACEKGWRAFRIQGVLDFSLIGILSKISTILADNGVGIFAVSTYNTDYVFTKAGQFDSALELLRRAGYSVV